MTWTPDRPTKPGKYELSLHSDARAGLPVQMTAEVAPMPDWLRCDETDAGLIVRGDVDAGTWLIELSSSRLDRALWRPYVEPPDPFAEPVPSLRERVEALRRLDPYPDNEHAWFAAMKATPDGDYLDRSEVLALLDEVTR